MRRMKLTWKHTPRYTAGLWLLAAGAWMQAQAIPDAPMASITTGVYAGSVTTEPVTAQPLALSLQEAVQRGLEHNLAAVLVRQNEQIAHGTQMQGLNALLPNITASATRRRNQIDLEALGFRPGLLAQFSPGFLPAGVTFGPVVTVNVVNAQANLQQSLFNWSAIEAFRAEKEQSVATYYSRQSALGQVIQNVADTYLQALADSASVDDAQALLDADTLLVRQTQDAMQAGTATHLDLLRAQVQQQQQQQALIAAQNALAKTKIALNRQIGLAADQPITLTDATPYADLDAMNIAEARKIAYANRQDYQGAQAQARAAIHARAAARWERMPSLNFNGNYGVTGTVGGVYHGTFLAAGELSVPLFREAGLRGDRDAAEAERRRAQEQLASLRATIDAQLRDSLLDVAAAKQLTEVAHSNVALARQSLQDSTERFLNGVEDNLAVVEAQAELAAAQTQWVNSLNAFNQAKLGLARNLGILEQQYRTYLGL
jgi:outer membrane protein TolC